MVTRDVAISVGIDLGAEASGNFLLDFAHPQIAFAAIIGERHHRVLGEEQYKSLLFLQPFEQIMRIRFGDFSAFSRRLVGDGRHLQSPCSRIFYSIFANAHIPCH